MNCIHCLGFECNYNEKTQNDKLELVDLILETRKKKLTFKARALLDVSHPKLHKLSIKLFVVLKLWVSECKWVVG
jgi:hypothetical protein